jgi:RND superfamily putative drug exporter
VVFAGGTVLLALSGLQFTGVPNFRSFGFAPGVTVLVTVLAAVTLLPALLSLAGMRVLSRKSRRTTQLGASASHSPTATRLARTVARRPLAWTFASTALLLLIAVPALDMRVGTSDAGNEAKETTVRRAYDLVRDGFGPGFNGPFLVAVDLEKVDEASLPAIAEQVRTTEGIFSVAPAAVSADGSAAVISATPTSGPQEASTLALLDRLRSALPTGVHVGGFTATMDDFAQVMVDHLWLVVTIVLAASILLMILAFRSVVVPIKAVVVNLLSVASAYGVLVTVFQTETGAALVGLPGPVPIAPFVPVLMFAILFGLSMDYEVFLLSRVREEFLRSGDSKASVVEGLSSTARVISSAALIMVTVFLGFALDPGVVIKMMGVGLATAIALDATVVRLVLVPATMTLLGDRSWYMPRWLDRILPVVDTHGTPAYERTPPIEVALAGAPTNR